MRSETKKTIWLGVLGAVVFITIAFVHQPTPKTKCQVTQVQPGGQYSTYNQCGGK